MQDVVCYSAAIRAPAKNATYSVNAVKVLAWMMQPVAFRHDGPVGSDFDVDDFDVDDGENRAPICGFCGVTALPGETANVIDAGFVCDNADCEGFGEPVDD